MLNRIAAELSLEDLERAEQTMQQLPLGGLDSLFLCIKFLQFNLNRCIPTPECSHSTES